MFESHTTTTVYTSESSSTGGVTSSFSSSHTHTTATLSIHVATASDLVASQTFGKQDPYLRFSLDFKNKEAFLKTFTHKNGGDSAVWNQSFTLPLNGEPDLFVEVVNEEKTLDEVIGFCAIPINQIVHAPGANMNGLFDIYDLKGQRAGTVNLQMAALGFPNSQPADFSGAPVRGKSYVHEEHAKRMKSSDNKATGVGIGAALLGGALAVGAGFAAKKLYDNHKEQEEQERHEQEEKQRLAQEEEERRNRERAEFEAERERFEAEKNDYERNEEHEKKECKPKKCDDEKERHHKKKCDDEKERHHKKKCDDDEEEHHRRRRNSSSSDDDEDAKKWNPVGTYAAGDRVKYHGKVYVCLQGHTSNPTWTPDAAHSLWQAE